MSGTNRGTTNPLSIFLELTKARITIAVTLTTATGYFLAAGRIEAAIWMPLLAVLLLAGGSSVLNHCQDARIDARMMRTRNRPIPAGRIDRTTAMFLAGLLILLGFYVLASVPGDPYMLLLLGAFAVFWYNAVYTYLKRVTAFAVVPGALIGAIPPAIGYVAAGGSPTDPVILLAGMFFFIWQIPHFWLLLLMCGDQYAEAGLPTLTRVFSRRQLLHITFMWVVATAVGGLAFPTLAHDIMALPWNLILVCCSCWLVGRTVTMLRPPREKPDGLIFRRAFVQINVYALIVMICLTMGALAAGHDRIAITAL